MAPQGNEPYRKNNFDGLAEEIKEVIRDDRFQDSLNKFVPKNQTPFRIFKGVGFTLAIVSGLFGYMLKANSEADDRKAEMIHKIIDEKKVWVVKVDEGILQLRKTRYLIKYDCDNNKQISLYDQGKLRFQARHELVAAFTGIREIYGDEVFNTLLELTKFDENVKDVCAKDAPDDEAYRAFSVKVNEQMHSLIKIDRKKLEELTSGGLGHFFMVI